MYIARIAHTRAWYNTCGIPGHWSQWTTASRNEDKNKDKNWRHKWRRPCVAYLCHFDAMLFNHLCGEATLCLHLHHQTNDMNRFLKSNIYWSHAILFNAGLNLSDLIEMWRNRISKPWTPLVTQEKRIADLDKLRIIYSFLGFCMRINQMNKEETIQCSGDIFLRQRGRK